MFGSIKTLISNLVENAKPSNSANGYDNWLAIAALLTRVATVHNEMSEDRRKKLYTVLRSTFRLDDPTTAQLIEESTAVDREAIDLYHYTRQLNEEFDDEDRRHTVRMMWEVVYADGNANEFEANIIWRAADLLGVSSRQSVELRRQVAADNAAQGWVAAGRPQSPTLAMTIGG